MCGIAGEVRFNGRRPSLDAVRVMTDALAPRGPDGEGIHAQEGVALGHRRLKIVDLSERGAQPMLDRELGLGIVFNGMIYNYRRLRAELERDGYHFFSTSDTEVVLKGYHAWGMRVLDRLLGMFAFGIWERESGRVVLARDRLGIKPLYYSRLADGLRFASSLPALVRAGGVDTQIDPIALHHYMSFHSVAPAPHTLLKGVRKLPPASVMVIEARGGVDEQRYWELKLEPREEDTRRGLREWQELITVALETAVERRLVADVPVGVLLSGGLDSSLIVALLARLGQEGLKTFSIGFESMNGESGDEFVYSDKVAAHYGTEHHKIRIDSARALEQLPHCVQAMSEPMVSHDNIGFYLLSQEVAKHVKVVQSGQGADEVFGGYHWYPPLLESCDPVADYARAFFDQDHETYSDIMDRRFVQEDYSRAFVETQFDRPGASTPVDKALRIDQTVMLADDPVKRVDNMTMAWGLEARVPFLDHELVELAGRVPARFKVAGDGKLVLKQLAREILPAEVIDRPKGYFPVPALKYLRGEFLDLVREVLAQPAAHGRGLFQPAYVRKLLAEPEQHITPLRGSRLWQVALLELWLQTHGI